jgi:DNA-binding transcriptional regulator YhcF (GntR family)
LQELVEVEGGASLSLERLAGLAGMNRATTNRAVRDLEARELIEVTSGTGKAPNRYKLFV